MSEQETIAEIERYMVMPGQATSYITGALKIKELREKHTKQLGRTFNLAASHDELLKGEDMPLDLLERNMNIWAMQQKRWGRIECHYTKCHYTKGCLSRFLRKCMLPPGLVPAYSMVANGDG